MTVFPYLIVTSIDLEPNADGKLVLDSNANNGKTANFLIDVKEIGNTSDDQKKKYEVTKIDATQARHRISQKIEGTNKIPLFCVHGFANEPVSTLSRAMKRHEVMDESKYYPVFVIWPCSGSFNEEKDTVTGYNEDKKIYAPNAGEAFFDFVNLTPDDTFPRKSLMMHSMGNHVVFNGACGLGAPQVQFENIFLVAADVPHDIFMKNPNEDYSETQKKIYGNKNEKAKNYFQLLSKDSDGKPKGKIVVLHNGSDKALLWSSWVENWERRIGQRGMAKKRGGFFNLGFRDDHENVLDYIKDYYVNEDLEPKVDEFFGTGHGYQFDLVAVKIYDKYAL